MFCTNTFNLIDLSFRIFFDNVSQLNRFLHKFSSIYDKISNSPVNYILQRKEIIRYNQIIYSIISNTLSNILNISAVIDLYSSILMLMSSL